MQGIGITEWRDHGRSSCYPLAVDIDPNDLFVDASFVQFDNFIPQLSTVVIDSTGVTFTFLFDDGTFTTTVASSNCISEYIIQLRNSTTNRNYGSVVCGYGIVTLFNTSQGTTLTLDANFVPSVIRSIPSTAGLYLLQGVSGAIDITTDDNQRFAITGNSVTWNTIGRPSKVKQHTLDSTKLYAVTSESSVVEIDPILLTITPIFDSPIACTSLFTTATKLVGVFDSCFYDFTTSLPTPLVTIADQVVNVTVDSTGAIVALTPTGLDYIDLTSGITSTVNLTPAPDLAHIIPVATTPLYTTLPYTGVADQIWQMTPGSPPTFAKISQISINGSTLIPPIVGLATIGTVIYAATTDGTNNNIYTLNINTGKATLVFSSTILSSGGALLGLTPGNDISISVASVIPLATINGCTPIHNTIQLNGGELIQIEQTAANELTFNLAVNIDNTIVKRTVNYE